MKFQFFISAVVGATLATSLLTSCTSKVDPKDNSIAVAFTANVKGMDPLSANDQISITVIAEIYETLLHYNYLKRPYQLEPMLAEAMPTVSADGLTYTFKIKKGVNFQDDPSFPGGKGRELTAADFVYSFKRIADPKNQSEAFWIFDGKVKGLNEWAAALKDGKADYNTAIEGLQTPDANTLVIKLNKPYYQLAYVLAMPPASVVPHEAVDKYGKEFLNHPVGTGPYKLESWIHNSKVVLVKNPTYHQDLYPSEGMPGDKEAGLLADAGKQLPFADKLVFNELPEDQPRWQNFMKGNIDKIEIPNDNFDSVMNGGKLKEEVTKKGIALTITENSHIGYIGFNMLDPVLGKNKLLRQAMSYAYDSETFRTKFQNGRSTIAQSPLPPGLEGFDPNFKNPRKKFDVAEAKKILAQAGYPEGKGLPTFTFEGMSDSKARQHAEYFKQSMAAIGINVNISTNTWPQFLDKIKNAKAQIWEVQWLADYPDAQDFLQLFYSKNASPGPNDTNYKNPEFDKLYEKSLDLPPGQARTEIYKKMRDIVVEEAPWIFITHLNTYELQQGWVHNYKPSDIIPDYYKYIRVSGQERADLKPKL